MGLGGRFGLFEYFIILLKIKFMKWQHSDADAAADAAVWRQSTCGEKLQISPRMELFFRIY